MGRLVLVDTVDALPGLLPLHAWTALMGTDLIVVSDADHAFVPHLDAAGLATRVLTTDEDADAALSRADLLGGLTPAHKALAEQIVDLVRSSGDVAYLYGRTDREAFTRTLGMEAARAQLEVEVVYFGVRPTGTEVLDLIAVEERLRGPDGCPWDREQDHASLIRYAVEEVHELADAIASGDHDHVREELGDLLLQVVFHAQIAVDEGRYGIDEVARGIADKLVRRHPHVFGDEAHADSGSVMARWDELKAAEKPERTSPLDGVAVGQPALSYAEQVQRKAAKVGIEWREFHDHDGADDLDEASLGAALAGLVARARAAGLDPEQALRVATGAFRERAEAAWAAAGPDAGAAAIATAWAHAGAAPSDRADD